MYHRTIYELLADDDILREYLAISTIEETQPAIYNFWAPADTPAPYINLAFTDTPDGIDTHQRNATVTIDVFVKDGDRDRAELIKRRVRRLLLSSDIPDDPDDGPLRAYPGPSGAGEVREDDPAIIHINEAVDLIFYDLETIRAITE